MKSYLVKSNVENKKDQWDRERVITAIKSAFGKRGVDPLKCEDVEWKPGYIRGFAILSGFYSDWVNLVHQRLSIG